MVTVDLPILASMLIALSAVLSLVTIVSIYREGGILKRLRATPLRPVHDSERARHRQADADGRHLRRDDADRPAVLSRRRQRARWWRSRVALLFSTVCILSIGFLIASVVPTARFAQPIGSIILYPMLGLSGLFVPIDTLPPALQVASRAAAAHLRRVAAARHLARRRMGGTRRRCGCAGAGVCGVHRAVGQGVSVGVTSGVRRRMIRGLRGFTGFPGAEEPERHRPRSGRSVRRTRRRNESLAIAGLSSPRPCSSHRRRLRGGSRGFRCCRAAACRSKLDEKCRVDLIHLRNIVNLRMLS